MISDSCQTGRDRLMPALCSVSTSRSVPSGREVEMLLSPSTNAIRLPSGAHDASVTVVGNFTRWPPTVTLSVPSEMSSIPLLYLSSVDGHGPAPGDGLVLGYALGPAWTGASFLAHAASRATEAASAAVRTRRCRTTIPRMAFSRD
jgi:hypothetical protein